MKYARKVTQTKKRFRLSKKTLLWAIVGLFIAVQVFFTIQTAATGAKIANLWKRHRFLNLKKRRLILGL